MMTAFDVINFFRKGLSRKEKATFAASIAVALISSVFLACSPLFLSFIADAIINRQISPVDHYYYVLLLLCGCYLIFVASQRLMAYLNLYLESVLRMDTTKTLSGVYFNFLVEKNQSYFLDKNAGSVAQHLNQINNEFYTIVRSLVGQVLGPIFQLSASLLILFLSGQHVIGGMFLAYSFLFFINHRYFSARLIERKLDLMQTGRDTYETLIDSVSNISLARQFDAKDFLAARYDAVLSTDKRVQTRFWRMNFTMLGISAGLYVILFAGSFAYAVAAALSGNLSVGQFVMIATYVLMLTAPIEQLGDMFAQLSQSISAFGKFLQSLKETPSPPADRRKSAHTDKAVAFDNLSFQYPGTDSPQLRGLTFSVAASAKLSITGPSGGGKSTLFKLLTKQYDTAPDTLHLFGQDITSVSVSDLSRTVGYVAQETLVFKDTVRFNLMIANPDATEDMLTAALELADLCEFVAQLPNGLDTVLGDRGESISGGQKQRIAFARLFLRTPQLVLLDEATSSLDILTEEKILDNVLREFSDRTVISISHRPSALEKFNQIMVVRNGELVDHGDRVTLMERAGYLQEIVGQSGEEPTGSSVVQFAGRFSKQD